MAMANKMRLLVTVLIVQLLYAASHMVSKAAINMGVNKLVFLVYRNTVAVLFLAPFAYFLEQ